MIWKCLNFLFAFIRITIAWRKMRALFTVPSFSTLKRPKFLSRHDMLYVVFFSQKIKFESLRSLIFYIIKFKLNRAARSMTYWIYEFPVHFCPTWYNVEHLANILYTLHDIICYDIQLLIIFTDYHLSWTLKKLCHSKAHAFRSTAVKFPWRSGVL